MDRRGVTAAESEAGAPREPFEGLREAMTVG